MGKAAVVYWSSTGNTEAMAKAVAEGAGAKGIAVDLLGADGFNQDRFAEYDAVAFGCPAMGAEELEETVFEPMFARLESGLDGKRVALFGSYGWGDGEWMREWEERCTDKGAVLTGQSVICQEAPDDSALDECRALGAGLV